MHTYIRMGFHRFLHCKEGATQKEGEVSIFAFSVHGVSTGGTVKGVMIPLCFLRVARTVLVHETGMNTEILNS